MWSLLQKMQLEFSLFRRWKWAENMRPDTQCSVRNHLRLRGSSREALSRPVLIKLGIKGPSRWRWRSRRSFSKWKRCPAPKWTLSSFFFSSQRCACGALLIRQDVRNVRRGWRSSRFIEQSQVAGVLRIPLLFCPEMTMAGVFGATNFNNFVWYRHLLKFWADGNCLLKTWMNSIFKTQKGLTGEFFFLFKFLEF